MLFDANACYVVVYLLMYPGSWVALDYYRLSIVNSMLFTTDISVFCHDRDMYIS